MFAEFAGLKLIGEWIAGLGKPDPLPEGPPDRLLDDPRSALVTARKLGRGELNPAERDGLLAAAGRLPAGPVRDPFEGYLPGDGTAERKLGIAPAIGRFVLTVGSTANQNGTALFEGVTVMFLAQAYGLDLTLGQQVRVMVMSIVAGIGTAGVPGGSLPMVLIVAQSVGVPAEGMALILGVDRLLDMCRTTVNVSGDLVISALVDRK